MYRKIKNGVIPRLILEKSVFIVRGLYKRISRVTEGFKKFPFQYFDAVSKTNRNTELNFCAHNH